MVIRRWSVRLALLRLVAPAVVLLLAALLAGCNSGTPEVTVVSASTGVPNPASASKPAATASATATTTPAPVVTIDPATVGQGESLAIRVTGGAPGVTATMRVRGTAYPLIASPTGLWAVIGIPLSTPLGPTSMTVSFRDAGDKPMPDITAPYTVVAVDRPVDALDVTPEVAAILTPDAGERENALRAAQFSAFDGQPRWNGVFRQPLTGQPEITTAFGQGRSVNGGPVTDQHSGTDLAADMGIPVYAAAPARVSWAGLMPIRGNTVVLDHGAGVLTGYSHLTDIVVESGKTVQAGDLIGHVGSTGFSTGPHLHWELSIYGVNVDPMTWLTRPFGPPAAANPPSASR